MSPLKETWNGKESYEHQLASNDSLKVVLELEDQSLNSFELLQRIDCHMQIFEKSKILLQLRERQAFIKPSIRRRKEVLKAVYKEQVTAGKFD